MFIWKELVGAYPDAKVILTLRDPEAWYASAAETIFARMQDFADAPAGGGVVDPAHQAHMMMVNTVVVGKAFGGSLDKEHAIDVFNAHNEAVRRTVPPERLLVYDAGEGWEPLCTFLRVPLPEAPYSKVNTTEDFAARFPQRTQPQRT